MTITHNMGGTSVFTTTAGIKFQDGTQQNTAALPLSSSGNTILSDSTGITLTDNFGNFLQMTQTFVGLSLANSGGGFSIFSDGVTVGAGISDGQGNALLLGDGFGNFNLSNEAGHAGIINSTGDTCSVVGNPLTVGVSGGNGFTINSTSGMTLNCSLILANHTPTSSTDTGVAGTIAWDTSYLYVCFATNTWRRSALSTW